ncbi:MAG TPA: NUDIX hydrolase [Chloroflexota bacterium]|nr:NUDIX hydrolase [Chloroflexota bacterium]
MTPDPRYPWLHWARKLQAAAQNGLTYSKDPYDIERYQAIWEVAAEMMARGSGVELIRVRDLLTGDVGHVTPKVDVRGAVFREGAMLLVREKSDGLWTLPGGWADVEESPSEAVVREVYEESGYRTRAVKLLAVYDRDRHGHTPMPFCCYKMFFHCALVDDDTLGEAQAQRGGSFAEVDDVGFFHEDELPRLSISRVTPAQLRRLFAHQRHPDWPTDFD